MTLVAPPLLSRSELVDASILLAKRHFLAILRACLPALVPALALDLLIDNFVPDERVLLFMPVSLMMWGLAEGMAMAGGWDLLHGRAVTPGNAWRLVSRKIWAIAVGYALKWLFIFVGFLFFIAPGVYLLGRWFAVPMASIAEQASVQQAFSRSWELSRLDLKRVLLTLGLVELGVLVLTSGLPALLPEASAESPSVLQIAIQWSLGLAFLPLEATLTTLLYRDIRMRREGYDLQSALSGL